VIWSHRLYMCTAHLLIRYCHLNKSLVCLQSERRNVILESVYFCSDTSNCNSCLRHDAPMYKMYYDWLIDWLIVKCSKAELCIVFVLCLCLTANRQPIWEGWTQNCRNLVIFLYIDVPLWLYIAITNFDI